MIAKNASRPQVSAFVSPPASVFSVGFALTLGFGLLLDHFGMPSALIHAVVLIIALMVCLVLALMTRSMKLAEFFAVGRGLTRVQGMAALAAVVAGADLPLVLAASGSADFVTIVLGSWMALMFISLSGAALRRAGAFSLRQWLFMRFPDASVQVLVGTVLLGSGAALALAGLETAARLLASGFHLSHTSALTMSAALVGTALVLGGLAASVMTGIFAVSLALAALLLPLILQGFFVFPFPALDGRWSGLIKEALVLGLGLASAGAVLAPQIAAHSRRDARQASLGVLGWSVILLGIVAWPLRAQIVASLGFSAMLESAPLQKQMIGGVFPLFSGPQPVIEALMSVAVFGLALAFCLSAFQALAANLTESAAPAGQSFKPLSSLRLARYRLGVLVLVGGAVVILLRFSLEPRVLAEAALLAGASGIVPVMILAMWRRARSDAALISFYVVIGTLGGVLIADNLQFVRAHMVSAALYAMMAAVAAGGLIALKGDRASGADDARSDDEQEEER